MCEMSQITHSLKLVEVDRKPKCCDKERSKVFTESNSARVCNVKKKTGK